MELKGRTIFEVVLIIIIIGQAYIIYQLMQFNVNDFTEDMSRLSSFIEDVSCSQRIRTLYDYYESDDYDLLIDYGKMLLEQKFLDKSVYRCLAKAYYMKGQKNKAVEMLKKALKAGYTCAALKPKLEKSKHINKAISNYQLSEIYEELGMVDKKKQHTQEAIEAFKLSKGKNYHENEMNDFFRKRSIKKKFINNENL
jgi:tetratricopeptide (TPR) repeat protein